MIDGVSLSRSPRAEPPDGAGPVGPEQPWPQPLDIPFDVVLRGLNPLHHLPGVGMAYGAATGETVPLPLRIAGAGIIGGPVGIAGAVLMGLAEELIRMGPDLSRPSTPEGMPLSAEGAMSPVTPGDPVQEGSYLTLATINPDFLGGPDAGSPQRGHTAYAMADVLSSSPVGQSWLTAHGGGGVFA